MALQQLLYTWARAGLSGPNAFQPVAASTGLMRDGAARDRALKLCRYHLPDGVDPQQGPVSFGWIDDGPTRYAFRRTAVPGLDVFGRHGNFAAHILAGPREQIPALRLLGTYTSPSWWNGETLPDGTTMLPTITLEEFTRGTSLPPANQDLAVAVLAWLLRRPGTLSLINDPDEIVAAALAAAQALPGVADLSSLSTYEDPDSPIRPHVSGRHLQGADVATVLALPQLRAAIAVAQASLGGDPVTIGKLRAEWARHRATSPDIASFLRIGTVLAAAGRGDETPIEDLVALLPDARSAVDLLDYTHVQRRLAKAVLAGDTRVATALANLHAVVDPQVWDSFGALAAGLIDWHGDHLGGEFRRLAAINESVADAVARRAVTQLGDRPLLCEKWPPNLIAWAVKGSWRMPLATPIRDALVRRGAEVAAEVVPLRIDNGWRADVVVQAATRGTVLAADAAHLLAGSPELAEPFLAAAPLHVARAVLAALQPHEQAEIFQRVQLVACPQDFIQLITDVAARLDNSTLFRLLGHTRAVLQTLCPPGWAELVDIALRGHAQRVLGDPRLDHEIWRAARLGRYERRGTVPAWRGLLDTLRGATRAYAVADRLRQFPPELRDLPTRFALDAHLTRDLAYASFCEALREIPRCGPLDQQSTVAIVLLAARRAAFAGRPCPAGNALRLIADLVDRGQLAQRKFGSALVHGPTQNAATDLARALALIAPTAIGVIDGVETAVGRQGQSWLRTLPLGEVRKKKRSISLTSQHSSDILPNHRSLPRPSDG